jgi:endo-1,4-beta-mannosidase
MNFHLGINYWPISSAMYWWRRFDADEFARDSAKIRAAGFDSLRIFLLWEDFQPHPDRVSTTSLKNLKQVADIAHDEGLDLTVTLFTGHMSGVNWIPEWALQPDQPATAQRFRIVSDSRVINAAPRNWYSDQIVIDAQSLLAREVVGALSGHPAVWAWDLGNENSNCVVPSSRDAGIKWLNRIAGEIRTSDPSSVVTIGLHMEDLEEDRKLGPAEAATVCDFLSMHGYPIYCDWADSAKDAMLLPFLGLITYWLGGRDVLFQEFGAPTIPANADELAGTGSMPTLLSEPDAAEYVKEAIELLNRFGMTGAMLWCYGDYASELWSVPPFDQAVHERYFGLWRRDGSRKPSVNVIENFRAGEVRGIEERFDWIDIKPEEFYKAPKENLRRLYKRFRASQRLDV